MLDFTRVYHQVQAMAEYLALQAARRGEIPWTERLVVAANRNFYDTVAVQRWNSALPLSREALKQAASCGDQKCGGWCLLVAVQKRAGEFWFIHECTTCHRSWAADEQVYLTYGFDGRVREVLKKGGNGNEQNPDREPGA